MLHVQSQPIIAIKADIKEDNGYYDLTKLPQEKAGTYLGHFTVSKQLIWVLATVALSFRREIKLLDENSNSQESVVSTT